MPAKTRNINKRYDIFNYKVGSKSELIGFILGIVLLAVSFIPLLADFPRDLLCMISAVLCSYPLLIDAFYGLKKKKITGSLLLMIIVIGSMIIGRFFDAAMCALLIRIEKMLETAARHRESSLLENLGKSVADTGHLVREQGGFEIIDASDITVGTALAVLPGEILPVDALIQEGKGAFDLSLITGDTTPVFAGPGDTVPAGAINGQSTVFYIAYSDKETSASSRIYKEVKSACEKNLQADKYKKIAKCISGIFIAAGILLALIGSIASRSPFDYICRGLGIAALCFAQPFFSGNRLITVSSFIDAACSGAVFKSPDGMSEILKCKIILLCESVFAKRSPNVKAAVNLMRSYGLNEIDAVISEEQTKKSEFAKSCEVNKIIGDDEIAGSDKKLIIDDSELSVSGRFASSGDFTAIYNNIKFDSDADAVITGSNLLRAADIIRKCIRYRGAARLFAVFFGVIKIAAAILAAAGITPVWVSFAVDSAIIVFAFVLSLHSAKNKK